MRKHRVRDVVLPVMLAAGLLGAASCSDADVPVVKQQPTTTGTTTTPGTPRSTETPGGPETPGDSETPGESETPGGSQGPLPAECLAQPVTSLCLTFDFRGSTQLKGSNWVYAGVKDTNLPDGTCTEYGSSMLASTEVGLPNVHKVIGNQEVEARFDSTWPPAKTGIVTYPATGLVRVNGVAYETRNNNTTGKLELQPDGSGKYTLNKLVHTEGGDTDVIGSISGTISWTCMEPKS